MTWAPYWFRITATQDQNTRIGSLIVVLIISRQIDGQMVNAARNLETCDPCGLHARLMRPEDAAAVQPLL